MSEALLIENSTSPQDEPTIGELEAPIKDWFLVHTKPRSEKLAETHLQQFGLEIFCPLLKQEKIIRRKRRSVISPLFPGYLFAKFDPFRQYRAVHYATGVRRVVTFGTTIARVEESMIEAMKARLFEGCVKMSKCSSFTPGQKVRIQDGPLQGLEAIFEREMSDRQRVTLLLQSVAYQARVVVHVDQVANL